MVTRKMTDVPAWVKFAFTVGVQLALLAYSYGKLNEQIPEIERRVNAAEIKSDAYEKLNNERAMKNAWNLAQICQALKVVSCRE